MTRTFFLRLWWLFMLVSLLVLVWQVGTFGYLSVYQSTPIPKVPPPPQTTYLYDRHGQLLTSLHAEVNRTEVPFKEIPLHLKQAVVATEDKNFYREGGVSFSSILRAAWVNLTRLELKQGGSTITQQYVKNAYTGSEKTFARKTREAILAQKLDRIYKKDELLGKYLNSVYFGQGAYGVQAAAQAYFGTDARDLSLSQAATLAGLIPAPGSYDPIKNPVEAKLRRDFVLDQMAEEGYIPNVTAEAQKRLEVTTKEAPPVTSRAAYFVDYATRYLEDNYGTSATFGGGLNVTTSLEPAWQQAAEKAVRSNLDARGDPAAALVAIDPRTGAIRVMVGGRNFNRVKFNLASQGRRQSGSAFKPFTLAAALERGIPLSSVWSGPSSLVIRDPRCYSATGPWNPSNYGDSGAGTMSLASATHASVNTIFAQLVSKVGPKNVVRVAHRMGIESPLQPVCSITLGSQPVNPLEMTSGFATLAARGVYRAPTPLEEVRTNSGNVLYRVSEKGGRRAVSQKVADTVTYALQGVVTNGTGTKAQLRGRPVAGKTGTAQNYQDAWFCGYVPQLAACVWVGYPQGEIPMRNVQGVGRVYGGSIPAEIWRDFMAAAMRGQPVMRFANPFPQPRPASPEPEPLPEPEIILPSPTPTFSPQPPPPTTSPTPPPPTYIPPSPFPEPAEPVPPDEGEEPG